MHEPGQTKRAWIARAPFGWTSSTLSQLVIGLGVCIYLVAGLYTELRLIELKPLPDFLLEDFKFYEHALFRVLEGRNPYEMRSAGNFFYPPPALLIVEVFSHIQPFFLQASIYLVTNIALLTLIVVGIAKRYGYSIDQVWYWFILAWGFAPFLELLHIGQINVVTSFGIFLLFFFDPSLPILAGAGLSLAIITKVTPAVFLWYLVITAKPARAGSERFYGVRKRFTTSAYALVALLILVVISALRYGIVPFSKYPEFFGNLLRVFPLEANSQSLVAKLTVVDSPQFHDLVAHLPAQWQTPVISTFTLFTTYHQTIHRMLLVYILLAIATSGVLTLIYEQEKEHLFIVTALGMTLSPNILWYHHYVFLLLPLLVWMGWKRLDPRLVLWCFLGLLIVQIDRRFPPYGLLIHIWAHISLLCVLVSQIWQVYQKNRGDCKFDNFGVLSV